MADDTTDLLRRFDGGDREALGALYKRHIEWIRYEVRRSLGAQLREKVDSNDMVSEAMISFLTYGPRFTPRNGAQFRSLMSTVVRNCIRDRAQWFSSKRRDMSLEQDWEDEAVVNLHGPKNSRRSPEDSLEEAESHARLRLAIEILPPRIRNLIVMRNWDRLPFKEIADKLEYKSADAARVALRRAEVKLGTLMADISRGDIDKHLTPPREDKGNQQPSSKNSDGQSERDERNEQSPREALDGA